MLRMGGPWLRARVLSVTLVAAVLVAAGIVFWLLRTSEAPLPGQLAQPATPGTGTARILGGTGTAPFTVRLSDVQRAPGSAGTIVRVAATFINRGTTAYRADPSDFRLRDASRQEWAVDFGLAASCQEWPVTPVEPNTDLGPRVPCFRASPAPQEPLVVVWDPDVSFSLLGGPAVVIPLP